MDHILEHEMHSTGEWVHRMTLVDVLLITAIIRIFIGPVDAVPV